MIDLDYLNGVGSFWRILNSGLGLRAIDYLSCFYKKSLDVWMLLFVLYAMSINDGKPSEACKCEEEG